jgi:hypothetical protein
MVKKTTKETIMDFIKVHGDKYDYSKVDYINAVTKVCVICKDHGSFYITPNSHKNGSGCYFCGREVVENSRRKTNEDFILDCIKIHGDRYDYSNTEYKGNLEFVNILCKKHGEFKQKASKHLQGQNCKKCASEENMVDFVEICKEKYPHYEYDKVAYTGMFNDVTITCKEHGDFKIKPMSFYHKSRGCKKCIDHTKSAQESKWLDLMLIEEKNRNVYIKCGDKTYCVDGLDLDKKIVYEYYGDFFHGNPEIYDKDDINPLLNEKYGDLYYKTKEKEFNIKKSGYEIISIWENDFKKKIKNKK